MGPVFLERKTIFLGALVVAVSFIVGVVIGYFGKSSSSGGSNDPMLQRLVADQFVGPPNTVDSAMAKVDTDRLRDYLKELTREPHIAEQARDIELTNWIKESWEDQGMDEVKLTQYDFYLSWPNKTRPNKVHLLDGSGTVQFTSQHKEKELRPGDDHPNFVDAFIAYSPPGEVEGQLFYVNYARIEDFQELDDILGGSDYLKGKICLARYGKIFRGNKIRNCQDRGAIGVVLFSDPGDVAVQGTDPENVYPNTIFLPGSGVQRGTSFIGEGDPLSIGFSSVPHAYRLERDEVDGLPKIPAQPISYDDARVLMEKMGGRKPPTDKWVGKLNVSYSLGGEFAAPWSDWKVKLSTHNIERTVKGSNVIGIIRGSVEEDRYVVFGNHRDAWGYGAVDPSSGTAQLMEVVRVFGEMRKTGWRPRRTILFASWAAEEYGYLGSYEYVYQNLAKLQHRTVGVVNTDICVAGPISKTQASPVLRDIVRQAFTRASDPTGSHSNYYDYWKAWYNQGNEGNPDQKEPVIPLLGSGTDHAAFSFYLGVPSVNHRFKDDTKKYKGVGQYPTYHTGYETFYLMDQIIDPGFKIHKTCAESTIHMVLNLADSAILPYNLRLLPREIQKSLDAFEKAGASKQLAENGASLEHIQEAVNELQTAADKFMDHVENDVSLTTDPIKQRMINDQMMQIEKVFIMDGGLPKPAASEHRNALFAPGKFNKYGGGGFPAIPDLLYQIDKLKPGSEEHTQRWKTIRKHVSDLMIMIQSAARYSEL